MTSPGGGGNINLAALWVPVMPETSHFGEGMAHLGDEAARAGANFSQRFSSELSKGLKGKADEAFAGFANNFGSAGGAAEKVFSTISSKAGLTALAVGGVGLAAVGVGKQFYDMGAQWDTIADTISGKTGKIGEDLAQVTDSIKRVAKDSSVDIAQIADVSGDLAKSLKLSGQSLDDMTRKVSDLNALTGQQTNIADLTKLFHGFNIEAADQGKTLDSLYDTYTNTEFSVNELIGTLATAGPKLRALHLDLGESAGLLSSLAEAGVNADTAISSLGIAVGNLSKSDAKGVLGDFLEGEQGRSIEQRFADVVTKIHELAATGQELAANDLGRSVFGRSWTDIGDAIKSDKLDVDALNQSVENTGHTIEGTKKATDDAKEGFTNLKNTLQVDLAPVADAVFKNINRDVELALKPLETFLNLLHDAGDALKFLNGPEATVPNAPPISNPLAPTGGGHPGGRWGGGEIFGAGPKGQDSVPVWAAPGEHMFSADDVDAMGGQANVYAFRQALHRAGGGAVLPEGPGTYVITPNNIMSAVEFAQSVNGNPYQYGGTGPLYDCSGFMSTLYAIVTGRPSPPGQRYFTTESDFTKFGFLPGFDPSSPFNIGVHRGGGGPSSHMAGTLAGHNVESGSHGTVIGGLAKGANDPEFENKYHLPGPPITPKNGGVPVYIVGADKAPGGSGSVTGSIGSGTGPGGGTGPSGPRDTSALFQQFGSELLGGVGEEAGFPDVFGKAPWDWGVVKLATGLANWGMGELNAAANAGGFLQGLTGSFGLNLPKMATDQFGRPGQGTSPAPSGSWWSPPPGPGNSQVVQGDYQPINITQTQPDTKQIMAPVQEHLNSSVYTHSGGFPQ